MSEGNPLIALSFRHAGVGPALTLAKLLPLLDTVVGSDEVPHSKPAPDGILEACRRLGVAPAETIMVGDSRFDEGAAKSAGADFRWFTSFADLKL